MRAKQHNFDLVEKINLRFWCAIPCVENSIVEFGEYHVM